MINKGSKGPDLVEFVEVPKMFQKVLEYVRNPELAILEELTIIGKLLANDLPINFPIFGK